MPALLTRISILPNLPPTCAAKSSTDRRSVTSHSTASACPPVAAMASTVQSSGTRLRPPKTTTAPKPASFRPMAAPIPRPPPVITATWPFNPDTASSAMKTYLDFVWQSKPPDLVPSHHNKAVLCLGVRQLAIVGLDTYNPAHRNIFLARGCSVEALDLPG